MVAAEQRRANGPLGVLGLCSWAVLFAAQGSAAQVLAATVSTGGTVPASTLWRRGVTLGPGLTVASSRGSAHGVSLVDCGRRCMDLRLASTATTLTTTFSADSTAATAAAAAAAASATCGSFAYNADVRMCYLAPALEVSSGKGLDGYALFIVEEDTNGAATLLSSLTAGTATTSAVSVTTRIGTTSAVTVTSRCGVGQGGYTTLPGNQTCIKLGDVSASWDASQGFCTAEGGRLLRVQSTSKMAGIYTTLVALGGQNNTFWVDATDNAIEGAFYWGEGSYVLNTFFVNGEPDNGAGAAKENCLVLLASAQKLGDRACSTSLKYICELGM